MKLEVWTQYGPLNSEPIFKAFIKSLQDAGDTVILNRESDADVAVIWSVLWLGRMRNYKKIWQRYRQANKPVIVLEVGGLRRNKSFKVAINGVNRKADFANQNVDDTRWPLFQHTLKPWQQRGQTIIVLGQHNASEQWVGMPDMRRWFESQVQQIRKHTDRPIVVRGHPGDKHAPKYLKSKDWQVSTAPSLTQDLLNAHCTITYNSSPSVASAIEGIPTYVTDPNPKISQAYAVANTDLSTIETPQTFERQEWIEKLAMCHWNFDELSSGEAWAHMRDYV